MDNEIWKPVPGFEGLYSVSSQGRVRSERVVVLKGDINNWGYPQVALHVDGTYLKRSIHSLVAEAFIGPRPPKQVVNHINGIKTDNRPDNLEYTTQSGNHKHAYRTGLKRVGEKHHRAKLCEGDIRLIRAANITPRGAAAALAKQLGVSVVTIRKIHRGVTWEHSSAKAKKRRRRLHHGVAKLTPKDVKVIRATSPYSKEVAEQLARRFHVSVSAIHHIHYRRSWQHVR